MDVEKVKAMFADSSNYLYGNTSIAVRVSLVGEMVRNLPIGNFVELGCGDGSIALSLLDKDKHAVLVDFSESMLEQAKVNTPPLLRNRVEYVASDISAFNVDEKFDLVICVGVLAHLESIEEIISKFGSLLKGGGYLILQFTESRSLFGIVLHDVMSGTQGGYVVNKMSRKNIFPLLARHHFSVLAQKTYSDSSFGVGRLSPSLGQRLKRLTARLDMPLIFSEVIVLSQYIPE